MERLEGIKVFIPITPMGAVRTTQKQKWMDTRAQRYFTYKQQVARIVKKQFKKPITGPIAVEITFHMPIPKNGKSNGKKVNIGQAHIITPDIDNMVKGCFDAINRICWHDDKQVFEVTARKVYSNNPGMALEVWGMDLDGPKTEQVQQETEGD